MLSAGKKYKQIARFRTGNPATLTSPTVFVEEKIMTTLLFLRYTRKMEVFENLKEHSLFCVKIRGKDIFCIKVDSNTFSVVNRKDRLTGKSLTQLQIRESWGEFKTHMNYLCAIGKKRSSALLEDKPFELIEYASL